MYIRLCTLATFALASIASAAPTQFTYPLRCNWDKLNIDDRNAAIEEIRNFRGLHDQLPTTSKQSLPLSKQCGSWFAQCVHVSIRAFRVDEVWAPIGAIELAAQRISDECGDRGGSVEVESHTHMVVHMTWKWA